MHYTSCIALLDETKYLIEMCALDVFLVHFAFIVPFSIGVDSPQLPSPEYPSDKHPTAH